MIFDKYLFIFSRRVGFLLGIINILISCLEEGKEMIELSVFLFVFEFLLDDLFDVRKNYDFDLNKEKNFFRVFFVEIFRILVKFIKIFIYWYNFIYIDYMFRKIINDFMDLY